MLRKILVVAGSIVFLLSSFKAVKAEDLKMRPYLYTQGFEGETDPVQAISGGDGTYTVNFKGLTEEKSFSGKKSFKLDVTFQSGSSIFWSVPIPGGVPAEGKLRFSGHILLGEETAVGASAGLGLNYDYPPTSQSVSGAFNIILESAKGEWKLVEGDAIKMGTGTIPWLMGRSAWPWPATEEDIGVYAVGGGLFLYGGKGERIVVYIDDLKLEGTVPTEDTYREAIKKKWIPLNEKRAEKISSLEKALQESEKELDSLTNLSPGSDKVKEARIKEGIASFKAKIENAKKTGFINLAEQREIDSFLEQLKNTINNIKAISKGMAQSKDMIVYVTKPTLDSRILPTTSILPGIISREIKITAAPGKYQHFTTLISIFSEGIIPLVPLRSLVFSFKEVISVRAEITKLAGWYLPGAAGVGEAQDKEHRVLVPELLLNDDALVKVDYQEEKNYLKVVHSRGTPSAKEEYIWISDPTGPVLKDGTADLPVQDSPVLLPVDIPSGTNKQFWITVKAPETAKAGVYTGSIMLTSGAKTLPALTLTLTVLPFTLASPKRYDLQADFVSSIYYHGKINPAQPEGSISSNDKSKEQLKAELKDLFIHGVTNPQCNQGPLNETLFGEYLTFRNEVGMGGQTLYLLNWCPGTVRADSDPALIKQTIAFAKSYGIPEVYFYGADEASGDALTVQRPAWIATRNAGGKIFVAGYIGNFEPMGDIQDLIVFNGRPSPEEAARWHSVGHKIWCYANPQGGVENPEIYRRNFGLLLWKADYDGAATFSYQANADNVWNDFDNSVQRDFMMAYPTVNGVIDTVQWEGYREGMDDIRYATTLKLEIAKARKSADAGIKETALAAEKWLSELDVNNDLDTIRLEMINYILKLRKEAPVV